MPGYESTFKDFLYLLDVGSKQHIDQVAAALGVTADGDGISTQFRDPQGHPLTHERVHEMGRADPQVQRLIYNLWMTYAH
jgi:hypothetical protein